MKEVYNKKELNKLYPNKYKRLLGVDYASIHKMETIAENVYIKKVEELVNLHLMKW